MTQRSAGAGLAGAMGQDALTGEAVRRGRTGCHLASAARRTAWPAAEEMTIDGCSEEPAVTRSWLRGGTYGTLNRP
jgi:hypothetical protein